MRKITEIIIHCSATEAGIPYTASDIDHWHRQRGWSCIGYHYVVRLDGSIEKGRDEVMIGAHCRGHNAHSIGICYIGGLLDGKPADTRTPQQKAALAALIRSLKMKYPEAVVLGHRDTGALKACPCFDARIEYFALFFLTLAAVFLSSCSSSRSSQTIKTIDNAKMCVLTDSTSHQLHISFDQLDYEIRQFCDTLYPVSVDTAFTPLCVTKRLRITHGRLSSRTDSVVHIDSVTHEVSKHTEAERIRPSPTLWPYIFLGIITLVVFLRFAKKKNREK